ncbi:MAG: methyltransferase domain-containing protein [Blastocatellia bacterium]|nr:methyltransferase domain-containing protein [Blastocatellia bacterium]
MNLFEIHSSSFIVSSIMAARQIINSEVKTLEQAMSARFGWQTGAAWRDGLLDAIKAKAERLKLDEAAYCRLAISSPGELEVLADMVSNSETRFFRQSAQFEALSKSVIPELIGKRANERRLDLWSAACSTGEEPYSLAIALCESLPASENWRVGLLATDLRGSAIISASRGRYPASVIGALAPHLREKYFTKADANGREELYDVESAVRGKVAFQRANIYAPQFWKNMKRRFDLVMCNNVLIYFHALAIKQTVERIANVLEPGGLLIVMENEAAYINHPALKIDSSLPGYFFRKV